jgi:hypothetical protein
MAKPSRRTGTDGQWPAGCRGRAGCRSGLSRGSTRPRAGNVDCCCNGHVRGTVGRVPKNAPTRGAVTRAYHEELSPGQRSALLSWLAFTTTFAGLRMLTYSIRAGKGPFQNISVGGEHLHHYMWGIGMLAGVGAVAVRGEERHRRHPAVAVSYGGGLALITDEFALLLDLKDVYWARQGRISIDIGVGGIAAAGSYFAALPVLRRLRRERREAPAAPAAPAAPEPTAS